MQQAPFAPAVDTLRCKEAGCPLVSVACACVLKVSLCCKRKASRNGALKGVKLRLSRPRMTLAQSLGLPFPHLYLGEQPVRWHARLLCALNDTAEVSHKELCCPRCVEPGPRMARRIVSAARRGAWYFWPASRSCSSIVMACSCSMIAKC